VTTIPLEPGSDPRDVDITSDGVFACVPAGDEPGGSDLYVIDIATLTGHWIISVGGESNSNVIAVAPEPLGGLIFSDGFESGDTIAWTLTTP